MGITGLYHVVQCPKCQKGVVAVGPLVPGDKPIKARCTKCAFEGEFLVYGNTSLVIYCRTGQKMECWEMRK
jgi:hypothetical protein